MVRVYNSAPVSSTVVLCPHTATVSAPSTPHVHGPQTAPESTISSHTHKHTTICRFFSTDGDPPNFSLFSCKRRIVRYFPFCKVTSGKRGLPAERLITSHIRQTARNIRQHIPQKIFVCFTFLGQRNYADSAESSQSLRVMYSTAL